MSIGLKMYKKLKRTLKENKISVKLILIVVMLTIVFVSSLTFGLNKINTTEFCIGCHEMEIIYEEYKLSNHFNNKKGIRPGCSDCHVPNDYPDKLIAKIFTGGKDTIMHFVGVDMQKDKLNMAHSVWKYMKDRNSRECKNCHNNLIDNTDHIEPDSNCITCHMRGSNIAHNRPWENGNG